MPVSGLPSQEGASRYTMEPPGAIVAAGGCSPQHVWVALQGSGPFTESTVGFPVFTSVHVYGVAL
jgi:hypothetical protein